MKTQEEIEARIAHIKTLGNGLGINERRIRELEWVLKTSKAKVYKSTEGDTKSQVKPIKKTKAPPAPLPPFSNLWKNNYCENCGEGYDNEEEWKSLKECALCGHPKP